MAAVGGLVSFFAVTLLLLTDTVHASSQQTDKGHRAFIWTEDLQEWDDPPLELEAAHPRLLEGFFSEPYDAEAGSQPVAAPPLFVPANSSAGTNEVELPGGTGASKAVSVHSRDNTHMPETSSMEASHPRKAPGTNPMIASGLAIGMVVALSIGVAAVSVVLRRNLRQSGGVATFTGYNRV